MSGEKESDTADAWILGPVRAVLGGLLMWHALSSAEELARVGYFGDFFHMPIIPDAFVPTARAYTLLVAARVCAAVMVTIGVWARPALAFSAIAMTWTILSDRLQFHHNRYSLALFAFLLAFAPCDRSWRAAMGPAIRTGSFWAVRLAQLQLSIIYLASGLSKLLDADWRDGAVVADRIHRYAHVAIAKGVPARIVDILANGSSELAKLAIMTELFLAIALWIRPLRVVALWVGLWFHIVIQVTSNVETFGFLALAVVRTLRDAGLPRALRALRSLPFRGRSGRALRPLARLARPLRREAVGAGRCARTLRGRRQTRRNARHRSARVRHVDAVPAFVVPDLGAGSARRELHPAGRFVDAGLTRTISTRSRRPGSSPGPTCDLRPPQRFERRTSGPGMQLM